MYKDDTPFSPKRAQLASFEHAYAVAVQKRRQTGRPQVVLRTADPAQPFRVTSATSSRRKALMALIA